MAGRIQPKTISETIASYSQLQLASPSDFFWGFWLVAITLGEMFGSLVGLPTITGQLYAVLAAPLRESPITLWVVITLLPQTLAVVLARKLLRRTTWPAWLSARRKSLRGAKFPVPDVNDAKSLSGTIIGFVVIALLAAIVGTVPQHRLPLAIGEIGLMILVSLLAGIEAYRPQLKQIDILSPEPLPYQRLPHSPVPIELNCNNPDFERSLLFFKDPQTHKYQPCDVRARFRLDNGEHLLLNIDVFEKRLPSTTTGSSANVFRCDGHFGLIFRSPSASEEFERNSTSKKEKKQMLEGSSVDFLIRNLFATQKLGDLLTARLNVALNVYAGELDAAVKSLVEDFALDALVQVASSANRDLDSQSTGSFLTPDAYISQLERTVEEIKAQKKPLKDFQESWKVARNRQETALQEFPAYFRKELIRFLVEESSSNPSATSAMDTLASQSIKDVLTWIDIRFMVTRFEFTPAALDAEKLVSTKVAVLTEQLQAAVQKLTEARHSRQSEILDVLKGIITAITADTRTMATQRGIALAGSIAELISGTGKGVNRSQLLEQGPALIAEYHNLEAESKGSSSASPATNKEPRQRAHLDVDDQDGTLGPN